MLITSRVSEKSYKLAANNVYVFDVPLDANKAAVIQAVEAENKGVKVRDVRLAVIKGKPKAVNRGKRARPTQTVRKDTKKAYVTLAEGKIEVSAFTEIDNQAQAEAVKQTETKATAANAGAKKASLITRRRTGNRGDK